MTRYEVILTGQTNADLDVVKATATFARVFKLDHDKARTLVTGTEPRRLARNASREKAERYLEVLTKIGIHAEIKPPLEDPLAEPVPLELSLMDEGGFNEPTSQEANLELIDQDAAPAMTMAEAEASEPTVAEGQTSSSAGRTATEPDIEETSQDVEIEVVPIGNGLQWLSAGFDMFRSSPLGWIVATVLLTFGSGLFSYIPEVGAFLFLLVWPLLIAGLMLGAHRQYEEGLDYPGLSLLLGFNTRPASLLMIGLLYSLSVLLLVGVLFGIVYLLSLVFGGEPGGGTIVILTLLAIFPPIMILWFAPPLVAINGLSAIEACKIAIFGGARNILPFSLYMVGLTFVLFLGALLLGLGLLVAIPVMYASTYAAYRDIFRS